MGGEPATLPTPAGADIGDANPGISSDAPATFPLGSTDVTWTATDASGNISTAIQVVVVADTTPPTITAPPSITGLAFAGFDDLIACGDVAVRCNDWVVCDNDGAVVIPVELAGQVADAGVEQERFERFIQEKVKNGASVMGLYPPDEAAMSEYQRWLESGGA